MGNAESRFGYHVLRVKPDSPASKATLSSYFDYIVAVNDQLVLEDNQALLANAAKNSLDQPLNLSVYNSRNDTLRRLSITPSLNWGDEHGGMLGCSVRFVECSNAKDRVWHVLNVIPGGSAERAGLCANTDFIIASLDKVLMQEEDFLFLIEKNPGCVLKFVVYNSELDSCREVLIEVGKNEFGTGVIGCEIGFGQIHQVPTEGDVHAAKMAPTSSGRPDNLPAGGVVDALSVHLNEASLNPTANQEQVYSETYVEPFRVPPPPQPTSDAIPTNVLQTPDAFQAVEAIVTPQQLEQQFPQTTFEGSAQAMASYQNPEISCNLSGQTPGETENSVLPPIHPCEIPPPPSVPSSSVPSVEPQQVSFVEQAEPSTAVSECVPIQSSDSQLALSGEFNIDNVIFTPQESQPSTAKAVQAILEENVLEQTPIDFFSQQPVKVDEGSEEAKQSFPIAALSNDSQSIQKLFNSESQSSLSQADANNFGQLSQSDSHSTLLNSNPQIVERDNFKKSSSNEESNQISQLFQSSASISFQ